MDYTTQGLNFPLRYMVLGLDENGEYTSFTSPFEDPYYTYYDGEYTWDCAFSASNFRKLLSGRPSVIYPEVTVYYGDIGGDFDYTPEKTNGKTVYKYDITDPNTGEPFFELPQYYGNALSYEPKSYLYNNLMEQRDYRFDGQGFKLAKKERYNRYAPRCFASMDYQYNNNAYSYLYCYSDWNTAIVNAFIVGRKNNLGISLVQSKETTTYYSDNDSINITECYEYNNRNQMNYKFFLNSDNKFIKETYIYPEINNGGSTPAIIQNMVNKNIISSIIQTTTSTGNDFNFLNEIVGYKTEFKEFTSGNSTIIMPAQSYELEFKPTGNEYVLKEEIISYSSNGNPLEFISRDGIHNSYIWGYNDTYPVIKAENLTIAQLNSLVSTSLSGTGFSSLETLLNSITSFPNTSWNTFNQNLRNNASTAMITTYTYKPLIGMTSVTDPSGNATYYEYDSFGRLQYVRERDGNIIQQYKYHYKE